MKSNTASLIMLLLLLCAAYALVVKMAVDVADLKQRVSAVERQQAATGGEEAR